MDSMPPAYKRNGERRFRETSGLYWEDFLPGDVFEHRPGRTVLDTGNVWFTLLTLNVQPLHFDAAYAAKTEWKKLLVESTFTFALLTGMSVRTVSAKVVANLGWDKVKATPSGVFGRYALCGEHRPPQARVKEPADAGDRHGLHARRQSGWCRGDEFRANDADPSSGTFAGRGGELLMLDPCAEHGIAAAYPEQLREHRATDVAPTSVRSLSTTIRISGSPGLLSRRGRGSKKRPQKDRSKHFLKENLERAKGFEPLTPTLAMSPGGLRQSIFFYPGASEVTIL